MLLILSVSILMEFLSFLTNILIYLRCVETIRPFIVSSNLEKELGVSLIINKTKN